MQIVLPCGWIIAFAYAQIGGLFSSSHTFLRRHDLFYLSSRALRATEDAFKVSSKLYFIVFAFSLNSFSFSFYWNWFYKWFARVIFLRSTDCRTKCDGKAATNTTNECLYTRKSVPPVWYKKDWLCCSSMLQKLFCWPCFLFCTEPRQRRPRVAFKICMASSRNVKNTKRQSHTWVLTRPGGRLGTGVQWILCSLKQDEIRFNATIKRWGKIK